ncbi:malignant fibrous histiocytoma-amplified sequence 1 homolog [Branchiostoma floridae]|uniref:non-specific serine/threonine protein kinase n=1 Tax=Branchiostoma floridae TaxID=7739 RepID=A0A9J7M4F8_BRAFL|nr:malignant fibrous histiocytoma-amplified sequence 1 homolog [Branchiostoma floridae]
MPFSNLFENPMVVIELYGGYVGWILMTCLVATVVAICFYYLVKGFQNRQTEEGDSLPQPGQVDESRVEDTSLVEDVSPQQDGQESLTCPVCKSDSCNDDHESTFLFHREQYKDHVDEERINLTQRQGEEDQSLTVFEEINQFKQLKAVTIIGMKLDDSSLSNLFQCTSIRTLKLSNCQLASIPRSLANLKDLEILDLSHNNLTTLPTRPIRSLPCLKSLNVSHNKIAVIGDVVKKLQALQNFDVSYNDVGQVPYEILEMESLEIFSCSHNKIERWLGPPNEERQANTSPVTSLNMSNNLLTEVPQHVKELKNLLMVNFAHNKIGANIPDKIVSQQISELFYLPSVSTLRLGNNNIKTLPPLDTTRLSQNIVLIDLINNEIGEVPAALLSMPTLRALYLGSNKITRLPADLDLNKLSPTLYDIDLSNNEVDDLPLVLCFLPSLKKLSLKQNKITSLSENMKSCKSLSFLDMSHNMLKEIPSHVFGLPELKVIDVSNNQITTVSSLRKEESSVIEEFTLAENGLSQFPEVLIQMKKLKKVDLRRNKIKEIPESTMGMAKDVKLQVQDNPIVDPPLQVCQAGLEAIQAFYEDLTTASSITQCLKTLFLGTYEAGKTSLVRVFKLNRSCLTKPEERTDGIEIAELHLSVPNTPGITVSVWDFAGQEIYYITHQFFLSAKALILLIVNLEEYESARFYSTCGNWVENIIAKVRNPVIIPVVTHIDKLSSEEVEQRCEDLAKKLEDQERRRIKDLQKQLERIDESLTISKEAVHAIDRKKQIDTLLQKRPLIHPKPVPVSSGKNLEGIQYLKQVILNYAVNKELFPEVGRLVPKAWADTEACVDRKGKELDVPYMTWDEFTSLLKENVPNLQPESRIKTVAQYLHDTGKILWYSEIESLQNHVFLKPASLVDIFRKVIRYNFEDVVDYDSDSCYREADITPAEFQKMKIDLVRKGVLHTKLLRCLWSDIKEKCRQGTFNVIFNTLIELMQQFDLCYDLDREENDNHTKSTTSSPERLLLPWHLKEDLGEMAKAQWESGGSRVISLQYQFPSFIPPGLFARLAVRAHNPKHNLHFVLHWNTGALCKHKKNRMLVLLENEGTERLVVSLSVRPESKDAHTYVEEDLIYHSWSTLKMLTLEIEELLKQWPGVRFDRFTACPKCHQPSFPGEWLHRRYSRHHRTVICCFCNERVNLHDVLPPLTLADHIAAYIAFRFCHQEMLPDVVSDRQLLRVAQKLGAEWESLAIHLGFTQADVYKFKCDHPHSAEQQILAMLTAWKTRKGRNATRHNLQLVLREAGVDYDAISSLDDYRVEIEEG